MCYLQICAPTNAHSSGSPLSDPVKGQHCRFFKRRAVERTGGVGQVMLGEQDSFSIDTHGFGDQALDPQFIKQPGPHALHKEGIGLGKALQRADWPCSQEPVSTCWREPSTF